MQTYVVQFGNIKVVDEIVIDEKKVPRDRFVGVGGEIRLDENDPLVTTKHEQFAYDREGQPYSLRTFLAQVVPAREYVPPVPVLVQPLPVVQDDDGEEVDN